MSLLEKFFAFSFFSAFAVAILATWWRYLPTLITFYRSVIRDNRLSSAKYL
jgi:hypothetical protein